MSHALLAWPVLKAVFWEVPVVPYQFHHIPTLHPGQFSYSGGSKQGVCGCGDTTHHNPLSQTGEVFYGVLNLCRGFIQDFCHCINALTRKATSGFQSRLVYQAFLKLKQHFTLAVILKQPRPNADVHLRGGCIRGGSRSCLITAINGWWPPLLLLLQMIDTSGG